MMGTPFDDGELVSLRGLLKVTALEFFQETRRLARLGWMTLRFYQRTNVWGLFLADPAFVEVTVDYMRETIPELMREGWLIDVIMSEHLLALSSDPTLEEFVAMLQLIPIPPLPG